MPQFIGLYFISMLTVFVIDLLWLGVIAKNIYSASLGIFLRQGPNGMAPIWPAAIMVYVFIALGITLFVLPKANGDYAQALIWGVLFGAVLYGVYDFTNYSLIANWPLPITIIDFIWGMVLCGSSSVVVTFIQNRFFS